MYGATWAVSYRTGIRVRGALLALLYKHLMNAKSLRGKTPAEIVNMFANDGQRIFDAVTFAPLVIVGPFVLIGGLVYLLRVIGVTYCMEKFTAGSNSGCYRAYLCWEYLSSSSSM